MAFSPRCGPRPRPAHSVAAHAKQFGGTQAYAEAIDASLDALADMLETPDQIRSLLLGNSAA